jgi:hypothetical protein
MFLADFLSLVENLKVRPVANLRWEYLKGAQLGELLARIILL